MEKSIRASGVVGRSARLAHAFVRDQLAALVAPVYLLTQYRLDGASAGHADQGDIRPAAIGVRVSASTRS